MEAIFKHIFKSKSIFKSKFRLMREIVFLRKEIRALENRLRWYSCERKELFEGSNKYWKVVKREQQ